MGVEEVGHGWNDFITENSGHSPDTHGEIVDGELGIHLGDGESVELIGVRSGA